MSKEKLNIRFGVLVGMIVLAAASRFISPFNFSPIGAIALFGAAYFSRKIWALIIPLAALWVSSLILDNVIYAEFYDGFQWFSNPMVYLGFGLMTLLGFGMLKKINVGTVLGSAVAGTAVFFLVTNFGSWLEMPFLYSRDFAGLTAAYAAGLPFLKNTLLGNVVYASVLFGAFEWMKSSYPLLERRTLRGKDAEAQRAL